MLFNKKKDNDQTNSDLSILTIEYVENADLPNEYIKEKIDNNDLAFSGGITSNSGSTYIGQCY